MDSRRQSIEKQVMQLLDFWNQVSSEGNFHKAVLMRVARIVACSSTRVARELRTGKDDRHGAAARRMGSSRPLACQWCCC